MIKSILSGMLKVIFFVFLIAFGLGMWAAKFIQETDKRSTYYTLKKENYKFYDKKLESDFKKWLVSVSSKRDTVAQELKKDIAIYQKKKRNDVLIDSDKGTCESITKASNSLVQWYSDPEFYDKESASYWSLVYNEFKFCLDDFAAIPKKVDHKKVEDF